MINTQIQVCKARVISLEEDSYKAADQSTQDSVLAQGLLCHSATADEVDSNERRASDQTEAFEDRHEENEGADEFEITEETSKAMKTMGHYLTDIKLGLLHLSDILNMRENDYGQAETQEFKEEFSEDTSYALLHFSTVKNDDNELGEQENEINPFCGVRGECEIGPNDEELNQDEGVIDEIASLAHCLETQLKTLKYYLEIAPAEESFSLVKDDKFS